MRTSNIIPMSRRSNTNEERGRDRKRSTTGPRGKRATIARRKARALKYAQTAAH